MRDTWNNIDMIDYIKNSMLDPEIKVISFDIFDTLLCRPFYDPTHLFRILNYRFERFFGTSYNFSSLREQAEKVARETIKRQDVTLDEIYMTIEKLFRIDCDTCYFMKLEEIRLEKEFCSSRKAGQELFRYAINTGKDVVLISDMYLSGDIIREILLQNGYDGYQDIFVSSDLNKRKSSADIYKYVLKEMKIIGKQMLHIGDNWQLDCEIPQTIGINTVHFPKAIDVFEDRNQQYGTNNCGSMSMKICGQFIDYEQIQKSTGYGCMVAMAANKYFDNPFRSFVTDSDFNNDPYLVGYHMLGMHLIGLLQWIESIIRCGNYKRILYTSRDGWLIKKAYEIFRTYNSSLPEAEYIYVSRAAVLPQMIKTRLDLFDLPIDVNSYTPEKLVELLGFCLKPNTDIEIMKWCETKNINFDKRFEEYDSYCRLVNVLWDKYYDENKHWDQLEIIRKYFSQVRDQDIFFDMGYSARIQYAVNELTGKQNDVMFVHSDAHRHYKLEQKGDFKIHSFYDFIPYMSDVMREIAMSETGSSCIGYNQSKDEIYPVFEKVEYNENAKKIITLIHEGALDFVKEFYDNFYKYREEITFKSQEVSLPWEGFLRFISRSDSQIFSSVYMEDKVFAGEYQMNLADMIEQRLEWLPDYAK